MGIMDFFSRFVPTTPTTLEPAHQSLIDVMVMVACGDGEVTADEYNVVIGQATDFIGVSEAQVQQIIEQSFSVLEQEGGYDELFERLENQTLTHEERGGVYMAGYAVARLEYDGLDEGVRELLADIAASLELSEEEVSELEAQFEQEVRSARGE